MESEILAELRTEIARLHERLDGYETMIGKLAEAMQSNPMLKALIPGGLKVS